nr:formin-like protein 16 [Lolium perenne]
MPLDREWGLLPLSSSNPPSADTRTRFPRIDAEPLAPYEKRVADEEDPDPFVGTRHKMGRTHTSCPDLPSASAKPQVLEHATQLMAEAGSEFLEKLASQGQKNKALAADAGSSQAPPAKRSRREVVGGKEVTTKHYRKRQMPVSSGPALKTTKSASGMRPERAEDAPRPSSPPQPSPVPVGAGKSSASPLGGKTSSGCAAPKSPHHRAEEDLASPPEKQDTGANNTGAGTEEARQAEPLVPPVQKKKKKDSTPSRSQAVPESSAPASSAPAKDAPEAPAPPKISMPPPAAPSGKPAPAPSKASMPPPAAPTGKPAPAPSSLVLHTSRAALVAGETASAQLGRITELHRQGADLGHLLDYAEKWNQADLTLATRGVMSQV